MRILLFTDLKIGSKDLFWCRDLGLLTKAFRELGHDARLVVHPTGESTRHSPPANRQDPVIWASPSDVRNPLWWQRHKPDLVILGLWTRPKYDPIRRAALSATPRIIERADSDGMRTASCGLRTYARRRYDYFRDRTGLWPAGFSIPVSTLYSAASILATPWIEARLAKTLRLIPGLAVETPAATDLWKKLAARLGNDPSRIHWIPHPIQSNIFQPDPAVPKTNQVISVGRWESYQKNLPLLLKTLHAFLNQNPVWSALVICSGLPETSPHPRITFSSPLTAPLLARRMQESKIFLSTSRYESFGLAAAEAHVCGCRIVAKAGIMDHLAFPSLGPRDSLLERLDAVAREPLTTPPDPNLDLSATKVACMILDLV